MRKLSSVVAVLILCSFGVLAEDIQPPAVTTYVVVVGKSTPVPETFKVTDSIKDFVSAGKTAAGTNALLGVKATDGELSVDNATKVRVVKADIPLALKIIQGEPAKPYAVVFRDAKENVVEIPYVLESAKPTVAAIDGKAVKAVLSANVASDSTSITVKVQGTPILDLPDVTVVEGVKDIQAPDSGNVKPLELVESGRPEDPNVVLVGANTGKHYAYPDRKAVMTLAPNDFAELLDDGRLRAKDQPGAASDLDGHLTFTVTTSNGQEKQLNYLLKIHLRLADMVFVPPSPLLPVGGETKVMVRFRNRVGVSQPAVGVRWTVPTEAMPFIGIAAGGDEASIVWTGSVNSDATKSLPAAFKILASAAVQAPGGTSQTLTAELPVRLLNPVVAFEPLDVHVNLMDNQMVSDLFGQRTAKEFFVAHVGFMNESKDGQGRFTGASILAFSDSVEVGVVLQKRRTENGQRKWERQQPTDKARAPGWNANDWVSMDKNDLDHLKEPRKVRYDPLAAIQDYQSRLMSLRGEKKTGDALIPLSRPADRCLTDLLPYRPNTYEMVVNSFDPRTDRSSRERTLRGMNFVGTLASAGLSVSPPTGGSVMAALSAYSSLLIPGLQKVFPSLRDTQRQNIVSQTMKPIEEIPFGSEISRVLFFPKGAIDGVLEDHEVRIAEICPFTFTIQVAVVNKNDLKTATVANVP